jgi:hypothetical protein
MAAVTVEEEVVVSTAVGEAASTAVGMVEEVFMADPPTADIMAGATAAECMAVVGMGILLLEGPGRPRATECGTLHRDSIHLRDPETARGCQPLAVREWLRTAALA